MKYNDPFAKNAPASKGAGGTGVGRAGEYPPEAKPPAPSEAGREVRVGDPAVSGTGLLSRSEPERTTSRPAAKKLGGKKKERPAPTVVRQTDCPRWMHHRAGVYCKTCGKTP